MGRRYHCEYCEKSFKNDAASIQKHLNSLMHQRAKQDHYANFKDLETILREESNKTTCSRYRNSGDCQFGAMCRFSHYSPAQLQLMRQQLDEENLKKSGMASLADWLQKRSTLPGSSGVPADLGAAPGDLSAEKVVWAPSPSISILPNLPPSLHPVTLGQFKNFHPQSWG